MLPVTELTMATNTTFTSILNEIQCSNLNFSIQITPFAAYITLKKSVQKDLNGDFATPSPSIHVRLQQAQQEILQLQNENNQLKSDIAILVQKCENSELEHAYLENKHVEISKNVEALTALKEKLHDKLVVTEKENSKKQTEVSRLESKVKEMKKKQEEESKDFKYQIRDLEVANKRKVKEIHDLGRNLENTRSTVKSLKFEKSQLKTSKTKLENEIRKLKKVKKPLNEKVLFLKSDTDQNANNVSNAEACSELPQPSFLSSMVTHWNPHLTKANQRPGSMLAHCASSFPVPGHSSISMAEIIEAFDKALERWFPSYK